MIGNDGLRDGNSRIIGIQDQTDAGGKPPNGFIYGTLHDTAAIAGYLQAAAVPTGLGCNDRGHRTSALGRRRGTARSGTQGYWTDSHRGRGQAFDCPQCYSSLGQSRKFGKLEERSGLG